MSDFFRRSPEPHMRSATSLATYVKPFDIKLKSFLKPVYRREHDSTLRGRLITVSKVVQRDP